MGNLWERFDGIAKPEEVLEAKNRFAPLEVGDYVVVLEELEPGESRSGLPMIKGKFRVLEGGRLLFYNQVLQNINNPNLTAQNIAEAISFMSGLAGDEIDFVSLSQFCDDIVKIGLDFKGEQYNIRVSYGKKDTEMKFPKLRIIEPDYDNQ